jgi:hypothetical protein
MAAKLKGHLSPSPKHIPIICHLPYPPSFSLPTTFKICTRKITQILKMYPNNAILYTLIFVLLWAEIKKKDTNVGCDQSHVAEH